MTEKKVKLINNIGFYASSFLIFFFSLHSLGYSKPYLASALLGWLFGNIQKFLNDIRDHLNIKQ